jgi:IclR family acetate operon transcriptional repressor
MPDSSLGRAARILTSLDKDGARLTDICSRTGLNIGTVHRLLRTLKVYGFVVQSPFDRRYHLGHSFIKLAWDSLLLHQLLIVASHDEMKSLNKATKETVALIVPYGIERVNLLELPSQQAIKYAFGSGHSAPLYASAGGKMLLAEFSDHEREVLLEVMNFAPLTSHTVTDKNVLVTELKNIQKQGYAISFGGVVSGTASVAVPIKNYVTPACLAVYGPEDRFDDIISHLNELKGSARRISKKLLKYGQQAREIGSPFQNTKHMEDAGQERKNRVK